jgi:glycosyltransferase involved in cell wall biosynthesis
VVSTLDFSKRLKIVVLDANFYWSQQLFSACSDFADILLLKPLDYRAFHQDYGGYFIDRQPQQIANNVWEQRICCPPGWLFNYWLIAKYFFARIIRQFQQNHPLIFAYCYPYYSSLASELDCYSVYYSFDNYIDYWQGKESVTKRQEQQAIERADLIVCTAEVRAKTFHEQYINKRDRILHLPHGCSPKFMAEYPLSLSKLLPSSLNTYNRPIAGYIGALSYRFDFHYLAKVAVKIPHVTILLGGKLPESSDGSSEWWQGVEQIRQLSNVHFIGKVPHEKVGEYLQSFNVLLMCYSQCNFNFNICPMKLWDYMGTSLPIVSNDVVPEVNLWRDLVHIAQNPDEYAAKIRLALNNPHWKSEERWKVAQAHTWKQQAQKFYQAIAQQTQLLVAS